MGSASVQAGRLERYREDDCSPCAKMMYIHMVKILQTSSDMGSKGIRSNINRGIKISPYFDIHLNWRCHQSPASLIPDSLTCRHPPVMPPVLCRHKYPCTHGKNRNEVSLSRGFQSIDPAGCLPFLHAGLPGPVHRHRAKGVARRL